MMNWYEFTGKRKGMDFEELVCGVYVLIGMMNFFLIG